MGGLVSPGGISSGNVKINGGNVTAINESGGISAFSNITINAGTVIAEATNAPAINSDGDIIINGGKITAIGGVNGTVKNAIAGIGWTDTEGTLGKTIIPVSETGQDISTYKKVLIDEGITAFEVYKNQQKNAADELAVEGDSAAVTTLITTAKEDIDAVSYDETKTLDENKAVVDAIIEQLEEDIENQRAADEVVTQINQLKAAEEVSLDDKDDIIAARNAYDALTKDQKALVSPEALEKLEACEEAYSEALAKEINKIENITEQNENSVKAIMDVYNELPDATKDVVDKKLGRSGVKKVRDIEKALDITDKVINLGDVNDIDLSDEKAVSLVRTAYELLTDSQKAMVSANTIDKLEAAEEKIEVLKADMALKDAIDLAKERLDDYADAKKLSDFTADEATAFNMAVSDGKTAINAAANKDEVAEALTNAKEAVDAAVSKIEKDRADVAAANKAVADAITAADNAIIEADKAAADEYASDIDKLAITSAKLDVETAKLAAQEAVTVDDKNSKAQELQDVVNTLIEVTETANDNSALAKAAAQAAQTAADQLAAAKAEAIERLIDYADAKKLADFTSEESLVYNQTVEYGIMQIGESTNIDAVSSTLAAAKEEVDFELENINAAREETAKANKAVADAVVAADNAIIEADKAAANEYASDDDKLAIASAKSDVETAKLAAQEAVTVNDKNSKAQELQDVVNTLIGATETANNNSAIAKAAAEAANAAAAQLAADKTAAKERLDDYADAKKLIDFNEEEATAFNQLVTNVKTSIDEATNKAEVDEALVNAKKLVDAAIVIIEFARVYEAEIAAEMAAADKAVEDAKEAADAANLAADTAVNNEYVSNADKALINTAKETLQDKITAANQLPGDATADQKNLAAKDIENAVKALNEAIETANTNAAQAKAAAEQLATAKTSANERLDDYSEGKAKSDFTAAEATAFNKAVSDGKTDINAATNKDAVASALTNAKEAVDAAISKIEKDRSDEAAANKAVEDAIASADKAINEADKAAADEYASDDDKLAIASAKSDVETAKLAAQSAQTVNDKNSKAQELQDVVNTLIGVTETANDNSAIAKAAAQAAQTAAAQLAAAKTSAIERLEDYSEAKAKSDASASEKDAYDKIVTDGKKAINDATAKEDVATALKGAKAAVDSAIVNIEKDRTEAKKVTDAIDKLPTKDKVETSDKAAIEAARKAYNALTPIQKKNVSASTVKKLEAAEKDLLAAEAKAEAKAKAEKELAATKKAAQATMNSKFKVTVKSKKTIVEWSKIASADGYDVTVQYCGKNSKASVTTINNNATTKTTIKKINGKKINPKKQFKLYVEAYKMIDGKKEVIAKSLIAHLVGKKNKKYTNVKSIKGVKKEYTVELGKTTNIKAKVKLVDKNKKHIPKSHCAKFRYKSSDSTIATVDKNGQIKGNKKGTCTIYVYSVNGNIKKAKVTVK